MLADLIESELGKHVIRILLVTALAGWAVIEGLRWLFRHITITWQ